MNRYVGPDQLALLQRVRDRDPQWFNHADAVADFTGNMVQKLHVHPGNVKELVAALLFRRIASGFEAVIVLAERGMHTEGLCQRRSMLEALFILGAVWKQPDIVNNFLKNDQHRLINIFKHTKQLSPAVQAALSPELPIDAIEAKLEALKASTVGTKATTIADYAKASDLFDYYLTDYSFSSEAAHHVAKDLERQIALDSDGNVDGLHWGPETELPSDLLSNAVDYMMMAVTIAEALFDIVTSESANNLRARTNELVEL